MHAATCSGTCMHVKRDALPLASVVTTCMHGIHVSHSCDPVEYTRLCYTSYCDQIILPSILVYN